jgi:hypothetical protein
MKTVLRAQADMVSKGLHVRDHDFPDLLGDVNAFHAKFGQEYLGKPRMLPDDLHDFRVKFHDEETHEYRDEYPRLVDAVERKDRRDILNALELQLDALCDAIWVVLGTADLQFGRKVFFEAWRGSSLPTWRRFVSRWLTTELVTVRRQDELRSSTSASRRAGLHLTTGTWSPTTQSSTRSSVCLSRQDTEFMGTRVTR